MGWMEIGSGRGKWVAASSKQQSRNSMVDSSGFVTTVNSKHFDVTTVTVMSERTQGAWESTNASKMKEGWY